MGYVRMDRKGPVAVLTLDRPPVNAIDLEILKDLGASVEELSADDSVGSIVITSGARCFCAGVDLKVIPTYDQERQHEYINLVNEVITKAFSVPKATVAAVNGAATAGGYILMLCCDYRIAVTGDYPLGVTEARVGIPFPVSTVEVLRHELARPLFRRLVLTGLNHPPERHLGWGVLDELVPPEELMDRALEMGGYMAGLPRGAYGDIKRQVKGSALQRIESAVRAGEPMLDSWITDEGMAGAAGMIERVKE